MSVVSLDDRQISITQANIFSCLHVVRNLRALDRKEVQATRSVAGDLELARDVFTQPILYSIHVGARPVCLAGATEMWPGVFIASLLTTEDFPKVVMTYIHLVKNVILPSLIDIGAHRIQAYVLSEYTAARRLLEIMGAKNSATLARFGSNQEDFEIFEWLKED